MAEDRMQLLQEADERGLLPPDMKAAFEEAKKRGIVGSASPQPQQQPSSGIGDFIKSIPTGMAQVPLGIARGEQIESEQRAMAFTDKPNAGPEVPTGDKAAATFGLHRPEGTAGRFGEAIGSAVANPASYMGPGGAAVKVGGAIASAVGSETAGELGLGLPGRIIGGALGGGAVAGTTAAVRAAASPRSNVAADLSRALERDQETADDISARLMQTRSERPNATLADVAKENVRGLVERIAQSPGVGRSIVVPELTAQQKGQMDRLAGDLSALTGTRRTAFDATQSVMASRAHGASPLYNQAYSDGDFAIWSPELERLSSSPTVKSAMQGAVRIWRDNAIADGYGAMNPGALVEGGGQLSFLSGKVPVFPNLQFWDYTKRLLDDKISAAIRAGQNQKVRTLTVLAQSLRNELDQHVPSFREARNAWGGPSQYLDAIEEGRNILSNKMGAEELRATLSQMTEAQQEGYRIGAVSAVLSKLRSDTGKMPDLTKYLRSPETRDKIAAIMPTPEAAESFAQRLDYEISKSELTGRSLGNSATARRLAERDAADGIAGDLVMGALVHGSTLGLLKNVLMSLPNRVRDTLRSRSDALLADILVTPGGAQKLPAALAGVRPQRGVIPAAILRGGAVGAMTDQDAQSILDTRQ